MWLYVDDETVLVNTDNVETIELSDRSIYVNTTSGKTHLFGRYESQADAMETLHYWLKGRLDSCS